MTLANTQLVPEFQHYFYLYVLSSTVNKNQIPMPVDIDSSLLASQTVIELLFSDTFPYNSYTYKYSNKTGTWPGLVQTRLMIYPSSQYLIPDSSGTNIYSLQTDDLNMLDVLVYYRHDSTSVTVIDTTASSISIVYDTTSNTVVVTGSINGLSTPLSKLIFLYLDLHINGNYLAYYNLSSIISDCSLLATCFELKLIDDYFDYMIDRGKTFGIECPPEET